VVPLSTPSEGFSGEIRRQDPAPSLKISVSDGGRQLGPLPSGLPCCRASRAWSAGAALDPLPAQLQPAQPAPSKLISAAAKPLRLLLPPSPWLRNHWELPSPSLENAVRPHRTSTGAESDAASHQQPWQWLGVCESETLLQRRRRGRSDMGLSSSGSAPSARYLLPGESPSICLGNGSARTTRPAKFSSPFLLHFLLPWFSSSLLTLRALKEPPPHPIYLRHCIEASN